MQIKVTDGERKGGAWAAGLPLKGHEKLELIDYYVFEGKGRKPMLFWQNSMLQEIQGYEPLYLLAEDKAILEISRFPPVWKGFLKRSLFQLFVQLTI